MGMSHSQDASHGEGDRAHDTEWAGFPSPSRAVSIQSHKDTDGTVFPKDGQ